MGGEGENVASWFKKKKKKKQVAKRQRWKGKGACVGSGRAGWGKSPQGFGVSEGSQPVQGLEEQCHVTLMGTVGSGSGTAPFACCQGGGTDQDERCSRSPALLPVWQWRGD